MHGDSSSPGKIKKSIEGITGSLLLSATGLSKHENGKAQCRELAPRKIKEWRTRTLRKTMGSNTSKASITALAKKKRRGMIYA